MIYRADQQRKREDAKNEPEEATQKNRYILMLDGSKVIFDPSVVSTAINEAVKDIDDVNADVLIKQTLSNVYDGMSLDELNQVMVLSARGFIDHEPNYSQVAARLLLNNLRREALTHVFQKPMSSNSQQMAESYSDYFEKYLEVAVNLKLLDQELLSFDLDLLSQAILSERDLDFEYLGLQTLYDRYFIHTGDTRIELPQAFFMRVAMGLAINEVDRETKAIEFYHTLSSFDFMSSTPTELISVNLLNLFPTSRANRLPDKPNFV